MKIHAEMLSAYGISSLITENSPLLFSLIGVNCNFYLSYVLKQVMSTIFQ
ncbi:hypothetical protein SAMN05421736_10271 [Evansella caseinilytica]|uniref:Uncharacterized protein n=1 Tax=Evansella caseinilytica TaxID=1503961 RepID=A0A1H3K7G8_9BACI|nr:hypothetical protein SAMN05421736_10271 [Evansella caseinilytica]